MHPWHLEDLLQALKSSDPRTSSFARSILVSIDNDVLAELLNYPDWTVRVTAALELGRRGDRRANNTLTATFVEAESGTRGEIATVLGAIGDEVATELLVHALMDNQPSVRSKAARALARIGRREKRSSSISDRLESASDLLLLQTLRDGDREARAAAAVALAAIRGEQAIEMMSKALQSKSLEERLRTVSALTAMRSELGSEMRPRVQAVFIKALEDESPEVRLEAVNAIRALSSVHRYDSQVIKALAAVYKRDENDRVRNAAGVALGDHRPKPLREKFAFKFALAVLIIAVLCWVLASVGGLAYQPKDPLPGKVSTLPEEGICGPNESVTLLSQAVLGMIDEQQEAVASLQPVPGDAFRIPCSREIEDILLGKKACEVLLFTARAPTAPLNLRFLVFRDRDEIRSIAVSMLRVTEGSPDGEFIELSENYMGEYQEISEELGLQVTSMLEALEPGAWTKYPPHRKDVFLPFVSDLYDLEKTENLRNSNPVVQHLLSLVAAVNPELSLGARVFTVGEAGASGMYRPGFKVIQKSMFQEPAYSRTLAHELVHATLDGIEDKDSLLKEITPYLAYSHPKMLEITLPIFYSEEIARSRGETLATEEAIAFLTGSLAAQEKQVYFFIRLTPIVTDATRDVIWLNEPLLSSDVELLVSLGLVPEWMSPTALGYSEYTITRQYYDLVNQYSGSE